MGTLSNGERFFRMNDYNKFIQKLAMPLYNSTPIYLITYLEIDPEGRYYFLGWPDKFNEFHGKREVYLGEFVGTFAKNLYKEGFAINKDFDGTASYDDPEINRSVKFLIDIELGNAISYMDISKDQVIRRFIMHSKGDKDSFVNFIINNQDLLKAFFRYFIKEFEKIKNKVEPIITVKEKVYPIKLLLNYTNPSAKNTWPDFLLKFDPALTLTKKEKIVLSWYIAGKTAAETAIIMGVTDYTVEYHLYHIKEKLGCKSKQQIIPELLKSGSNFVF